MSTQQHNIDNKDLFQRIADGDEAAFTVIFNQYWNNIYSVSLVLTKSEELAEDVTQEIFLKVWRNRSQLPAIERFDNYLFILARNYIFSEFRKLKIRKEFIRQLHDHFSLNNRTPEAELLSKESAALVEQAISHLAPQQQQVYRLSREQGLTHEAIAGQLGISVHTVRNHVVKAVKNIREFLIQHDNSLVMVAAMITIMR